MYKTSSHKSRLSRNGHSHNIIYDDIDKIKQAFADTAIDIKDKTGELFSNSLDNIKDTSSKLQNNVADYTAEKPFKSLGAVFLVGLGIGFLLRRSK